MKLDTQDIKKIALFEDQTGAKVKDLFKYRDRATFIVEKGEMGKALGRNKKNVHRLEKMLNERLKIVEFADDKLQFIINFLNPLEIEDIREEDGIVHLKGGDSKTNGLIIGKKARNLRKLEEIVNHYFDVEEIKVADA